MTESEIARLVRAIRLTYPKYYTGMGQEDFKGLVMAWTMVLAEHDFAIATRALQLYLSSDTKGFPPSPGQIVDNILRITKPQGAEMTAQEAWGLVRKAIRNGYYGAEEEFEKLPPACQRAIGNPASLREFAQMDSEAVETVEQSHFIRAYNTQAEREKEDARMPEAIKQLIQKMDNDKKLLEAKQEGALLHD